MIVLAEGKVVVKSFCCAVYILIDMVWCIHFLLQLYFYCLISLQLHFSVTYPQAWLSNFFLIVRICPCVLLCRMRSYYHCCEVKDVSSLWIHKYKPTKAFEVRHFWFFFFSFVFLHTYIYAHARAPTSKLHVLILNVCIS